MSAIAPAPDSEAAQLLPGLRLAEKILRENSFKSHVVIERQIAIINVTLARQPAALCKRCKGAGEFDAFVKSPFEQDGEMRSVQCPDCNGDGVRQPAAQSIIEELPEREEALHVAVCQAVGIINNSFGMHEAGSILRAALAAWSDAYEADRRQPAAREPEGQWVPKEPTEAMCDAGMDMLLGDCNLMDADGGGTITIQATAPRDLWRAMLRASEPAEGGA